MPGHLRTNPLTKTYDEVQRSIKRLENHLDINHSILSDEQKERIMKMLEGLNKALNQIPQENRVTRHHQLKQKD